MRARFGGLEVPLQAGALEPLPGDYLLRGGEVRAFPPFRGEAFFRHGWQSWSLAAWVDPREPPKPLLPEERRPQADDPFLLEAGAWWGSGLGALRAPGGEVLLLGALDLGARVLGREDLLLGRYASGEGRWFLAYGPEAEVFAAYARLLPRRLSGRPPRVWCSWYSFFTEIGEALLLQVLEEVAGLPFEVFQVDDGWQRALGDWEANGRFPRGMAFLAERIREKGLRAGLWLAPFLVTAESPLYRERPEWLLRDGEGRPLPAGFNWGKPLYALDSGNEEVLDHVAGLVREVRAWGYDYLKLDFLYAAALPGAEGEGRYRRAMERIREEAGDAYLLFCGAPILASLGLADGLRVGPDAAPYWDNEDRTLWLHDPTGPGLRNAIRTTFHRLWLGENVQVDPDVVYFRNRFALLREEERRLQEGMAHLTGFKATSDPPSWLTPEERERLFAFLSQDQRVKPLGPHRFQVGEEVLDYGPVL
ncbi:glycoside hydrolase family 36 protein [Thermus thermamylovorans]|uniref:Alpha-galactosidase n=1 Tax=Thermus thermamylovorans TaxID=2509362 RepID=A0A4Q9B6L5_9DEIN|nr:glycoside hydrolase family 36 protein [Thermus thermamylovorans]TBH21347.1 alpha-galactosidase [Thermus thermamylovorans]